jgi:ketosteroid isomerase-like protein
MRSANTAVVEAAYADLASGGLDGFIEHWAEDVDHRTIEGAPDDHGPIRGREAFRDYIQDWMDTFDEFTIEPVELVECGGNLVVGELRYGGRARLSRLKIAETFGVILTIRGGMIVRGREFATRDDARRAAGLPEIRRQRNLGAESV